MASKVVEWMIYYPLESVVLVLAAALIFFTIIHYLERNWAKMIRVGDKVVHDYSSHQGVVIAKRKDKNGYDYQVRFTMPENGEETDRVDWYRKDVLGLAA